jgi:hypothetical protein
MSNVKKFVARYKVEEMRMPTGDEGVGMWRSVVTALDLSHEQCSSTTTLWRSFRFVLHCTVVVTLNIGKALSGLWRKGRRGNECHGTVRGGSVIMCLCGKLLV